MVATMPKQGMMMGPMKGHLAPNSSPFKPTINKLSSQYLIQDHMSNHYTKLGTARAAIDNKPPRSMATSVKKRDQMRREAMAKQMKLLDFEKEMKHGSASPIRQLPDSSLYGSQQRLFSVTVRKNGYDEPRPQSVSSFRSGTGRMSPRPRSASSPRSSTRLELNSPRDRTKKPDILTQTYDGDYLDRHEDRFKNVDKSFTPRLKKRAGKSYLSQSKHYAPPLVVHKETKRKTSLKTTRRDANDISPTSSASNLQGRGREPNRDTRDLIDDMTMMEHGSESSRRLSFGDSKQTYDNIYLEQRSYDAYGFRSDQMNDTFFGRSSLGKSFSRTDTFTNERKNRIEEEEEEMKYLEFINSVTNDILTRGIYSDRVLTQVMQRHLDQNRGRLNDGRMRHMLMKLQEDLGVSSEVVTQGFVTPKYASSYDGSSVTGRESRSRKKRDTRDQTTENKKSWYEKLLPKKKDKKRDGATSDGSLSDGKGKSKTGILKTPATSSASDLDQKSATLSSGEDEFKTKKVTIKDGFSTKEQNEVIELINGLDLNEKNVAGSEKSVPVSPPKPVKRTSVGEKPKSNPQSINGDLEQTVDEVLDAKHDKKDMDLSDLDDF